MLSVSSSSRFGRVLSATTALYVAAASLYWRASSRASAVSARISPRRVFASASLAASCPARSAALRSVSMPVFSRLISRRPRYSGRRRRSAAPGDPQQLALIGEARLLFDQRRERPQRLGKLPQLHVAETLPQLHFRLQRRGRVLLGEVREPRQRLGELAVLVLHDAEERTWRERHGPSGRTADQLLQTRSLFRIVLIASRVLQRPRRRRASVCCDRRQLHRKRSSPRPVRRRRDGCGPADSGRACRRSDRRTVPAC